MAEPVKLRQRIERNIVRKIVGRAVRAGYKINIHNGGDGLELKGSTDSMEVMMKELFATDEEHIIFYENGRRVGWIFFIYGNGNMGLDVVSDYADKPKIRAIVEPVMDWLDKIQNDPVEMVAKKTDKLDKAE
jgi:hypothetical protein